MLCGERGIRTPGTLLRYTRFPGVPIKPLLHLSKNGAIYKNFYDGSGLSSFSRIETWPVDIYYFGNSAHFTAERPQPNSSHHGKASR